MSLKQKILYILLPAIVLPMFALGYWSSERASSGIYVSTINYMNTVLEGYVRENLISRHEVLKVAGIDNIDSFVKGYQKEALEAADNLIKSVGGGLLVIDEKGEEVYFNVDYENNWPLESDILNAIQAIPDNSGLLNLESGTVLYVATEFTQWGWKLAYLNDDSPVQNSRVEIFKVTLGFTLLISMLSYVLIATYLRRIITAPIKKLMEASLLISNKEYIQRIDVVSNDELGILALSLEGMSDSIHEHISKQSKWNEELELQVNERTRDLDKKVKEREILLKEVHHRVKNNMAVISSLLSLQSGYIDEKKYLDMFTESQNRIRSMALVHEKLYQSKDFAHIDVPDYVQSLVDNVRATFAGSVAIDTDVSVDKKVEMDIDTLVPCGLLINELITNAIKHAFDGHSKPEIKISMSKDNLHNVTLIVSDNGNGLPEDFDISKSKGLGLKLVRTLSKQIQAEMETISDNGAIFRFVFPEKLEFARRK